jgi:hypothetical protein
MTAKSRKRMRVKESPYRKEESAELDKVVLGLRVFVKGSVPGVRETMNAWSIPTFEAPDPFCFYMVGKNHVTFGFHFGTSLENPEGLLEGTGKNIRHVKLRSVEDLKRKGLKRLVQAAARLKGKAAMKGMRGK